MVAVEFQGLLKAGGGRRVVPGQQVHHAKLVQRPGLPEPVAELAPV